MKPLDATFRVFAEDHGSIILSATKAPYFLLLLFLFICNEYETFSKYSHSNLAQDLPRVCGIGVLRRRWNRGAERNGAAVLRRILIFFGTGNGIGDRSDFPITCSARSNERVALNIKN